MSELLSEEKKAQDIDVGQLLRPADSTASAPEHGALRELTSDKLSWFRTEHQFLHYGEIRCPSEFAGFVRLAEQLRVPLRVIGNGSNCLFTHGKIRSVVVKNQLPKRTEWLDEHRVRVSSSVPIMAVLKACRSKHLDSFYYLSSVPATIGGAVLMNAGRGKQFGQTIFDFIESVRVMTPTGEREFGVDEIDRRYRWTSFADHPDWLITGATFHFAPQTESVDKIRERVNFSYQQQDHSEPNCGSVFSQFSPRIMRLLMGMPCLGAQYSPKTLNWMLNRSKSSRGIRALILISRVLHRCCLTRCRLELVEID